MKLAYYELLVLKSPRTTTLGNRIMGATTCDEVKQHLIFFQILKITIQLFSYIV
jgi:hypothetical protein